MNNLIRVCFLTAMFATLPSYGESLTDTKDRMGSSVPNKESIKELIALTMPETIEVITRPMPKSIDKTIEEKVDTRLGDMQQNAAIEKLNLEYRQKAKIILEDELKWENYELEVIKIYESEFSKNEVDELIAFFKTPLGQTILKKWPPVNKKIITQIYKLRLAQQTKFERLTFEYNSNFRKILPPFIRPESKPMVPEKSPPVALNIGSAICPAPQYPKNSVRDNEEGKVVLDVVFDSDGTITKATIVMSSSFVNLDNAIKEYLLSGSCKATPPSINGVPNAGWTRSSYVWKLR